MKKDWSILTSLLKALGVVFVSLCLIDVWSGFSTSSGYIVEEYWGRAIGRCILILGGVIWFALDRSTVKIIKAIQEQKNKPDEIDQSTNTCASAQTDVQDNRSNDISGDADVQEDISSD